MSTKRVRVKSFAFCGAMFGDEGKGRIVDECVNRLAAEGNVVVYRDNGGANAGHTIEFGDKRVALHQLLSGVFIKGVTTILGKGMVLHPGDLVAELNEVKVAAGGSIPAEIIIDEMAVLSLDTHRAFENALKQWESGSKGSTGRGIAPAYADVILRHPLRLRDLKTFDETKFKKHYDLYAGLIKGLGGELATMSVPTLTGQPQIVGSAQEFIDRLRTQTSLIEAYIKPVNQLLTEAWADPKTAFVFEKAQAVGLDARWGVYPDVTASDCTFEGIFSATEGIIDPELIEVRAGVIKATYTSSVGSRVLPTTMEESLAHQIREDAHEYGATTKRPRDIVHLDIPALRFFIKVGRIKELVLTHMDIVYADQAIKVCTKYMQGGKEVEYRPDQAFLSEVKPEYIEFKPWDQAEVRAARSAAELPAAAKKYLDFLSKELGIKILMITTGPKREQGVWF